MKEKSIVTDIRTAIKPKKKESGVEVYTVGVEGLENLIRQKIYARLGQDRDALKAFEVKVFEPQNAEQAALLERTGGLIQITGALGLNDSGPGWKVFDVNIEQNLSVREDNEVADALAFRCFQCVERMKNDLKKNRGKVMRAV